MEHGKQSKLGIASFVISFSSGLFIFFLLFVIRLSYGGEVEGIDDSKDDFVILGIILLFFLAATLVALGLGLAGIIQKERKKTFAILGSVFSVIILTSYLVYIL